MRIAITTPHGYEDPATVRAHDLGNRLIAGGHEVLLLLAGPVAVASELAQEPRYLVREVRFDAGALEGSVGRLVDTFAPQIVHLWTPRHAAARAGLEIWDRSDARLVVHHEEDEGYVLSALALNIDLRSGDLPRYRSFRRGKPRQGGAVRGTGEGDPDPGAWPWAHPRLSPLAEAAAVGRTASTPAFSRWLCRRFTGPVRTLYPGVDHERFASRVGDPGLVRRLGLDGRTVLVHAGSAAGFDDFADYLEALPPVIAEHPEIVLLQLGEGRGDGLASSLATELGLEDHVVFTGPVSHAERPRYLGLADLFLGPTTVTRYEAHRLPREVVEYMAVGRPLLISDAGVADELDDGDEVVKLTGNSPAQIEAGLRRALELRSSWPAMGRRVAERSEELFDGRRNTEGLVSLYEELLRGEGGAGPAHPAALGSPQRLNEPPPSQEPPDSAQVRLNYIDELISRALESSQPGRSTEDELPLLYVEMQTARDRASKLEAECRAREKELESLRAHTARLEGKLGFFRKIPWATKLWRSFVQWNSKS